MERSGLADVVEESLPGPQDERGDHEHVAVNEIEFHQGLGEFAARHHDQIVARLCFERGHRLGEVALIRVVFCQAIGSASVIETTYFCMLFSRSVKGLLSVCLGQ